ncbi:hypothetical protein CBR_g39542 [Chara braunii]|uniref:t-SNARE coiled-coil homology domain-containing protein n=1 Tax=Chara braunii TaxID=69332 RepID=A0A388LRY8_CHABU|nr:hypothetical protein CBR_g39542 [Chara braunii]|eukprot:GBG85077.1 hypothetical protein CBR_g39542 [Chara braunii]
MSSSAVSQSKGQSIGVEQGTQNPAMSRGNFPLREYRSSRAALFEGLEEGPSTAEIGEQYNEKSLDVLQERVSVLKKITVDINAEAEAHNKLLDRMGRDMERTRGILSGTMDRFTKVFKTKSSQNTCAIASFCIVGFFIVYYLTKHR